MIPHADRGSVGNTISRMIDLPSLVGQLSIIAALALVAGWREGRVCAGDGLLN